jgi:hypothetical protein
MRRSDRPGHQSKETMFDPWRFEKFSGNGGSGARGLRRTLSGSGLKEAYRLGRELPQNSNDAARDPAGLVRMAFRLRLLRGASRRAFLELLQAASLEDRGVLSPLSDPLPLLYVEDHGTLGLGGIERADTATEPGLLNRYIGLCLTFGDAAKDAQGGGTFGFGKSVNWNASRSRIVLFHSRFDPEPTEGGITSRLIGCALFDPHPHGRQRFTGRAFLGKKHPEDDHTRPLTGADADQAAKKLGFTARLGPDETGTSILIVDSHFDTREHLEAIRDGIERYYWPRIVDGRLEVRFFYEDEELPAPSPRGNPSLVPYIAAYQRAVAVAQGRDVAQGEATWHGMVNRGSEVLGTMALCRIELLPGDGRIDGDDDEDADRMSDTVALIRTPRMVVRYHAPYQRAVDHHFAGVFLAGDSINPVLARSEPPAHNLWDPNADELSEDQSAIVRAVLEGIRRKTREFLSRQRAREVEPSQGCAALDRELADLVRMPETGHGSGRNGPGGGPERNGARQPGQGANPTSRNGERPPRAFTIGFVEGPRRGTDDVGRQIVEAKLSVEVVSAADRRAAGGTVAKAKFIQVTVHPRILTDDGQFDDTDLGVGAMDSEGTEAQVCGNRIAFRLGEDAMRREFTVTTVPLEHDEQVIDLKAMGHLLSRQPKQETTQA